VVWEVVVDGEATGVLVSLPDDATDDVVATMLDAAERHAIDLVLVDPTREDGPA